MPASLPYSMGRISLVVIVAVGIFAPDPAVSESAKIAFLAAETSLEEMGPHNRAAWEVANALGDATLLFASPECGFIDAAGQKKDLAGFEVAWYHQGDSIHHTVIYQSPCLAAIRTFAEHGGGVLLSGGSLDMVAYFGLETELRAQRRQLENFRDPAAMISVERSHPAFRGLQAQDGLVWLSRGGCPAVSDFYWGGPAEGMLLANTPDGVQRPLVEYRLASGRVLVFGWLWPDYADLENPHRSNLLTLTSNLIEYLATPESWRPIVIRSEYPPVAFPEEPGIAEPRWRALRMAIEDLSSQFPDRYRKGEDFLERLNLLREEHDRLPKDASPEVFDPLMARF